MIRAPVSAWAEQTNNRYKIYSIVGKAVEKMTTPEKIAYLKGVIAASNISDTQTKRIYDALLDVLDSLAQDVEFNTDNIDNVDSRLSEVDEDLDAVESLLYADDIYDEDYSEEEEDYAEDDFSDDFEEYEDYTEEFDESDFEEELSEEDSFESDSFEETEEDDEEDEAFDDALEDEEQGEEMYEIECPACHETIYLQESVILDGGVDCPNCGEPLEFDIEFEEE